MKLIIMQTDTGTVQKIEFQAESETFPVFKTAVRNWLNTNYPAMTLNEILTRIEQLTPTSILLDMT